MGKIAGRLAQEEGQGTMRILVNVALGGGMIGIDLFAGAGGMSLGATLAGMAVEFAVELDAMAAKTYSRNNPTAKVHGGDIRRVTRSAVQQWLGRQDTAGGSFRDEIEVGLDKLGYTISSVRLNAMDFGVPQDRTRFFVVGSRDGKVFEFPTKTVRVSQTVDDAIRDLPRLHNGNSICWKPYGRGRPSAYGKRLRGKLNGCCNHVVTENARFVINRYQYVPPGGNWEDIPARLMRNYADRSRCHTGIYHRLRGSAPSVVIGNFRKNMLIHPSQDRGLSVREAARIQSFPDWYTFCGSIGFQQQQVGNAVPPLLAKAVFRALVKHR